MLTSGEFFPPTQYQAARAVTLCLDASGNVALSSMANGIVTGVPNFTSGTLDYYTGPTVIPYVTSGMIPYGDEWVIYTSDGVFAYTPSMSGNATSGWFWEPPGNYPASTPIAVLPGYTLDASSGLLAWGGTSVISGSPPYLSVFEAASGYYAVGPSGVFTSGSQTNLLSYTKNFSNYWGLDNVTLFYGSGVAPDGSMTALYVQETDTDSMQMVVQEPTPIEQNTLYTTSVYAKTGGCRYLELFFDDGGSYGIVATYDLVSGAVTSSEQFGDSLLASAYISSAGSGWWRCSLAGSLTGPTDTTARTSFLLSNTPNNGWYANTSGSTTSGVYLWGPQLQMGAETAYTSNATLPGLGEVSGLSGVFTSLTSGYNPWLLGATAAYQLGITGSGLVSSAVSSVIPFTATCMAASGTSLVVAGVGPLNLGSGAYALAVGVSGTAMIAFPGSGMAISWVIGGSLENPIWTKLTTTTGLPTYSSGISVVWPPVGNSLILSDYILGNWTAYLYTGGTLSFQSSGAISGSVRGIAVTANSQFVGIPTPGSSGVYIIESTGNAWAGIGVTLPGAFPGCGAIAGIGPTTFAVGSSGQVALMTYAGTTWTSGSAIPINNTPSAAFYDPTISHVLWASNSGAFDSTQWTALSYGLLSSGVWSNTSGMVVGLVSQRYQALVLTTNSYNMTGLGPNGNSINYWSQPATGLTCLATPVPADYTFPIGSTSAIEFQNLNGPYSIELIKSGQYGAIASGGAAISGLTMLGQGVLPTALGYSFDGTLLLATTRGALGPLVSGSSGLTYMMASGGFSDMLVASGQTWLSTTVQGSLVAVSGL